MSEIAVSYDTLSGTYNPAPDYRITVPAADEWMNKNNRRRVHWSVDKRQTEAWRIAGGWAAKAAKVPALGPSRVVAELHVHARRRSRIDPANFNLTACAAVDGLVDVGIWPDDSADWVFGPDMRLGAVAPKGGEALVLLIWGKPCCATACSRHGRGEG